ncbi:hypothetical protein BV20DRAFT_1056964 [Pilatotrama ljubarskyi]|nr:hypothetical protein BV20DRAFT_1056964 [Pilatotrama ljubarskyi]
MFHIRYHISDAVRRRVNNALHTFPTRKLRTSRTSPTSPVLPHRQEYLAPNNSEAAVDQHARRSSIIGFLEGIIEPIWRDIEGMLSIRLHEAADKLKWPLKVDYPVAAPEDRKAFEKAFDDLLELQTIGKTIHDPTQHKKEGLYAIQALVQPIALREGGAGWFEAWVKGSGNVIAVDQYLNVISAPDVWLFADEEEGAESDVRVAEREVHPTNSAHRIKALVEQVTDRYFPLS